MKKLNYFNICSILLFLVIFGMITIPASAQDEANKSGSIGAQFLKIQPNARSRGMGGAFNSISGDPNVIFNNPAGIAAIDNQSFSISHLSWIADINYESLVYTISLPSIGTLGLSAAYLGTGDMEVTTTEQQEGTGETFGFNDLAVGLSYAKSLTDKFSLGVTVKFVNETIYKFHARGFVFDVGTQYKTGLGSLVLSMSMTNFGPDLSYQGTYFNTEVISGTNTMISEERSFESFSTPLNFALGVSYDVFESENLKTKIAIDAVHPNDYSERLHMGMETKILNILSARFGYKFNYDAETWSAGLGVAQSLYNVNFIFDYSYSTFSVFGNVSSLSLTVGF